MTKKAFMIDTALMPAHDGVDLGHTDSRFRHQYMSGDMETTGDITAGGNIAATGSVTGNNISSSELTPARAIAYSIALG